MSSIQMLVSALIKRWRSRLFPKDVDEIWEAWVNLKERDCKDLIALLNDSSLRDPFKARALFVLMMPDPDFCPFYWARHANTFRGYAACISQDVALAGLSPNLIEYLTELLLLFYPYVKGKGKEYSDIKGGYNELIVHLLSFLPQEKAEEVFQLFEVGSEDKYHPFAPALAVLFRANVSVAWKAKADLALRERVLKQISETGWEADLSKNLLWGYAQLVLDQVYDLKYSLALFANQIRFIIENAPAGSERVYLIPRPKALKIFKAIVKVRDEELLRKFSCYLLSDRIDGLSYVYDAYAIELANAMRIVLSDDPACVKKLDKMIEEGMVRIKKGQAKRNKQLAEESEIKGKMRK